MKTMTVYKFDTPDDARRILDLVQALSNLQSISVDAMAIVTWQKGESKPKTEYFACTTDANVLGGAFWGMLFGLIFFLPSMGMATSAASGALVGHFSHYGIDKGFIMSVGEQVTAGTSALFLLATTTEIDKVSDAVKEYGSHFTVISIILSDEQETLLQADFGLQQDKEATRG